MLHYQIRYWWYCCQTLKKQWKCHFAQLSFSDFSDKLFTGPSCRTILISVTCGSVAPLEGGDLLCLMGCHWGDVWSAGPDAHAWCKRIYFLGFGLLINDPVWLSPANVFLRGHDRRLGLNSVPLKDSSVKTVTATDGLAIMFLRMSSRAELIDFVCKEDPCKAKNWRGKGQRMREKRCMPEGILF